MQVHLDTAVAKDAHMVAVGYGFDNSGKLVSPAEAKSYRCAMRNPEIRKRNLELLVSEFGSIAEVARQSGTSEKYLWQILNCVTYQGSGNSRAVGNSLAKKLENGCNKQPGWMDQPHDDEDLPDSAQRIIDATRQAVSAGRLSDTDAALIVAMLERMTGKPNGTP